MVGAGIMGTGIAQLFAGFGFDVAQADVSEAALARSRERIRHDLEKLLAKGRVSEGDVHATLDRIRQTAELGEAVGGADFVIEAVTENLETKQKVFDAASRACASGAILATNTSILSPTEIASVARRPERCIGMHFFNPAPLMGLVEVVPGVLTVPETVEATKALAARVGKTPVVVKESPGGIVSRIMIAMRNEAVDILAEGIASAEDIDAAMRLGGGFPIGPLALIDLVGLDVHVTNSDAMVRETGNLKYRPHPLLRKMVRAGLLGRKTGRGFYTHEQ